MRVVMRGFAAALSLALFGCATGGKFETEATTAPGADLAVYQSFALQTIVAGAESGQAPLSIADANVQSAIRKQLVEKGYREVAEGAELRFGFETAAYVKEKVSGSPIRIGIGMGSFGGNVGGGVGASVPVGKQTVESEAETRLTLRAVDAARNTEVWVGSAAGDIGQGRNAALVESAVAAILADFPDAQR